MKEHHSESTSDHAEAFWTDALKRSFRQLDLCDRIGYSLIPFVLLGSTFFIIKPLGVIFFGIF
jgi:hypothetical protein